MSTREVPRAEYMEDQIRALQVQAHVAAKEKENQAAKIIKLEETIEDLTKLMETHLSSQATTMKENNRRMDEMQTIINRLEEENRFIKQQLEEKEEQIQQFMKNKHEEIEAITLKHGAELAACDRALQALVNQNIGLARTVNDMKKWLGEAAIDAGVAVVIALIGVCCGNWGLSIACGVGTLGLVVDCIRRLYNAYSACS